MSAPVPRALHQRRRPARDREVRLRPGQPEPAKFPPYYDDSVILGEFTQDTLRELKLDAQNRVFKINSFLPCGAANVANPPFMFECDNPMDLQWGADGEFYLLTYGDGFFNINPDAGMYKWRVRQGHAGAGGCAHADKTDGAAAADGQLLERGLERPRSGRLDHLRLGLRRRNRRTRSTRTRRTPTRCRGRYTVVLTVTDSSGKTTPRAQ